MPAVPVKTFLERGYNVVTTSRSMEKSSFQASKRLTLVDGDSGEASTAKKIVDAVVFLAEAPHITEEVL